MRAFRSILLITASVLLGAVIAGTVTMVSWSACIEDKAFHCWDIGFGSFWQDIDVHATAGDTIAAGWTWERLKTVRLHYLEAFWLLWALISAMSFWIFNKLRPDTTLEPTGVGAVSSASRSTSQPAGGSVLGR